MRITKDFAYYEFGCKCGACEFTEGHYIDGDFVEKLQLIRDVVKEPMIINSGLRCPKYNKSIFGSSSQSNHMKGIAADVKCLCPLLRRKIIQQAIKHKLSLIIYRRFIHLDMREKRIQLFGKY